MGNRSRRALKALPRNEAAGEMSLLAKRVSLLRGWRRWLTVFATGAAGALAMPPFGFLPALVQRSGWKVVSVPVHHRPRKRGTSNYGTLDRLAAGIVDLAGVFWLLRRARHPVVSEE